MRRCSPVLFLLLVLIGILPAYAQLDSLKGIVDKFDRYRKNNVREKMFVDTDRSFYLTGETVWMKIFVVDGAFHKPLDLSKVAYVEILDSDNRPLVQTKLRLDQGTGKGVLFLPATIASGNYQLRGYTRWMQNAGPEAFFSKQITIANPFTKLGLKPPATEKESYDVQFLPEGGQLVEGLQSKIGFRVVSKAGTGMDFRGAVLSESNDTIVRFETYKFGLGQFNFTPLPGHQYRAVLWNGMYRQEYKLPAAFRDGYVVTVRDTINDQLKVQVSAKFANEPPSVPYMYLLVHTREAIITTATKVLSKDRAYFLVDKAKLGDGISHITVFNDSLRPVSDRLYFKQPQNTLSISVAPSQTQFGVREKIDLSLVTQLSNGSGVPANLSVSVYKADSLTSGNLVNISSYILLTSDLRGNVESPEYYFSQEASPRAIDNLMLTHGWSRFKWEDVLSSKINASYIPEFRGHVISGRVVRGGTSKGVPRISASLSTPSRNIQFYLSHSSEDGRIQFEMQRLFGSRRLIFQTTAPADSNFRIETLNPFSTAFAARTEARFDLSETSKKAITQRSLDMQVQSIFFEEFNKPKDPSIDSTSFYGKPDEKYFLDDYTRFPTMEEVMREYVPGVMVRKRKDQFHFLNINSGSNSLFRENPLVLLDGVQIMNVNKIIEFDPRKVQRLDVVTHRYYYGHLSYEGLVSYTTYHGDLAEMELDPTALSIMYEGLQLNREFFSPQYETVQQRSSRIPDGRDLLFWAPDAKTDKDGKLQLSFFSSDVGGKYIGIVQGISLGGKPGIGTFAFRITDKDNY